ncbi:MAG: peptidase S1, partial [Spirochaetaceae bacterium]
MYSDIQVRLITVLEVLAGVFVAAALVFGGFYFGSKAGAGQITRTPAFSSDGEYRFTGEPLVFDHLAASDDVSFSVDEQRNIEIYQARNKGVVNISTETLSYNWFLEPVPREGSTGSGSIIDERGYVLTNHHVVADAYRVHITLADGEQVPGEVIGSDPENDLAVVKFDP